MNSLNSDLGCDINHDTSSEKYYAEECLTLKELKQFIINGGFAPFTKIEAVGKGKEKNRITVTLSAPSDGKRKQIHPLTHLNGDKWLVNKKSIEFFSNLCKEPDFSDLFDSSEIKVSPY